MSSRVGTQEDKLRFFKAVKGRVCRWLRRINLSSLLDFEQVKFRWHGADS